MAVGFSLVCNVSFCSSSGLLSGMQCVILLWMWVSFWYAISLYSGSGFLPGMQCVTLQLQLVSLWYEMSLYSGS